MVMHTDRFKELRKKELDNIFQVKYISRIWRNIVRKQLRELDIKDLYDHYDFNYNIEARANSIRNEILYGTYNVSIPLIYRIEKKFGICRHLVIPQPVDALIMQVLVETVADKIIENQPSENAFYSRDKHNIPKPHEAAEYGLSFRQLWKKMQKKIYKFNAEKEHIVVTDLANYYDSLIISELRKVFVSHVKSNEVLVDLLFCIIEEISWKPDYLPYSGKGLPTSNLEGIRLLAHSFLFEIDKVLRQKTDNNFTRWMDDYIIGVDDKKVAKNIISSISDMLKSRGLALNLAKTDIHNSKQAYKQFYIEENMYLDTFDGVDKSIPDYNIKTSELKKKFKKHYKSDKLKYWEKVAKRYITAFQRLESPKLLTEISDIYINCPGLRPNLIYYLSKLGFKKRTSQKIEEILDGIDVFDDISLYQICNLITMWEIPVNEDTRKFLKRIDDKIISISFLRRIPSNFYSVLWFKAKYNHSEDLLAFIKKYKNLWQADSFLRRQVTAIFARLLNFRKTEVRTLLNEQISCGIMNTVSVANQIVQFSEIEGLDRKLSFYLFPKNKQRPYPFPKFLVLCSVLNSKVICTDEGVKKLVKEHIKDPYYRKWLDHQYNIG